MTNQKEELDLEGIEATLAKLPRIPRFPAYFNDMRLLLEEVRRLRNVEETNRVLRQTIDSMATERLQLLKEVEQLRAT
jgi:hypothetical protein